MTTNVSRIEMLKRKVTVLNNVWSELKVEGRMGVELTPSLRQNRF